MAFPTIPTVAAGRILSALATAPSGTHTSPNLSSLTKNSGDLLIAIVIIYDGNSTNAEFSSWGGGFTAFADFAGTATMGIGCAYKWSTGSETGTFTVTSADTSTNDSAFFLLSIPGAHASTPPEAGSFTTGTSSAANPASFNPSGWDAEDTLWIAVGGSGETSTTGSYTGLASAPTNYTNYADTGISADAVGGVEGAVAFRQLNAASEDVGTFSVDVSNARNSALVIAVRPLAEIDGEVTEDASTRIAVQNEITETASIRVRAAGEVVETGSIRAAVHDVITVVASVVIALGGIVSETGSTRIAAGSEVFESGSINIELPTPAYTPRYFQTQPGVWTVRSDLVQPGWENLWESLDHPSAIAVLPWDGQFRDILGHHTITKVGTPGVPGTSKSGRAQVFDGGTDTYQWLDSYDPTEYTMAVLWTQSSAGASQIGAIRTDSSGPTLSWSHQLRVSTSGVLEHRVYDGEEEIVSGGYLPVGNESFIVGTVKTNGILVLYQDGKVVGTQGGIETLWPDGDRWVFGNGDGDGYTGQDGKLALLVILPRALTATEVQQWSQDPYGPFRQARRNLALVDQPVPRFETISLGMEPVGASRSSFLTTPITPREGDIIRVGLTGSDGSSVSIAKTGTTFASITSLTGIDSDSSAHAWVITATDGVPGTIQISKGGSTFFAYTYSVRRAIGLVYAGLAGSDQVSNGTANHVHTLTLESYATAIDTWSWAPWNYNVPGYNPVSGWTKVVDESSGDAGAHAVFERLSPVSSITMSLSDASGRARGAISVQFAESIPPQVDGEITATVSTRIAAQSEVSAAVSVRVAAHSDVTENASTRTALHGEVAEAGSVQVAQQSEVSELSSVRISILPVLYPRKYSAKPESSNSTSADVSSEYSHIRERITWGGVLRPGGIVQARGLGIQAPETMTGVVPGVSRVGTGVWVNTNTDRFQYSVNSGFQLDSDIDWSMVVVFEFANAVNNTAGIIAARDNALGGGWNLYYGQTAYPPLWAFGPPINGLVVWNLGNGGPAASIVQDGKTHVAIITRRKGGVYHLYVDGIDLGERVNTAAIDGTQHRIAMGHIQTDADWDYAGGIYHAVYVFKGTELTPQEVTLLNLDPFGPYRLAQNTETLSLPTSNIVAGEVTKTTSIRVAGQGEVTESGSVRVAAHSEVPETASTRIALRGEIVTLSPDIVLNGGFSSGSNWSPNANWSITGGVAHHSPGANDAIVQVPSPGLVPGRSYQITYTVVNYVAGTVYARLGTASGTPRSANGTYTETMVMPTTGTAFGLEASSAGEMDVDNYIVRALGTDVLIAAQGEVTGSGSIRIALHSESTESASTRVSVHGEVTEGASSLVALQGEVIPGNTNQVINGDFATNSDWTLLSGWSIGSGVLTKVPGAQTNAYQAVSWLQKGRSYVCTFTVLNYSAGTVNIRLGTNNGIVRSANGTYSEIITYTSTINNEVRISSQDAIGDYQIDNVSVIPLGADVHIALAGEVTETGSISIASAGDTSESSSLNIESGISRSGNKVAVPTKPPAWNHDPGFVSGKWRWYWDSALMMLPLWERGGNLIQDLVSHTTNTPDTATPSWNHQGLDFSYGDHVLLDNKLSAFSGITHTVVIRMAVEGISSNGIVFWGTQDGNQNYWQIHSDGGLYAAGTGVSTVPDLSQLTDGKMGTHVIVCSPQGISWYFNGKLLGNTSSTAVSIAAGPKDWMLGNWIGDPTGSFRFDGRMEMFSFHKTAFTAAQVAEITRDPFGPLTYHADVESLNRTASVQSSEITSQGSITIAAHGEVQETSSTRVASHSEVTEDSSIGVAQAGEVTESINVRIAIHGEVVDGASVLITPGVGSGEAIEDASVRVAIHGEISETASTSIALQNEIVESGSIRAALHGEVQETGYTRIALHGEFLETASVRIACQNETLELSSIGISGQNEVTEIGSVRVALAGEVSEDTSARISVHGDTTEDASVRIETAAASSEITETASVRVSVHGEVTESGSIIISGYGEYIETASTRIALAGEVTEAGSMRIGGRGEATDFSSVRIALAGEVQESASMGVAAHSEAIEAGSTRVADHSQVTLGGSTRIALQGEVLESGSVRIALTGELTGPGSTRIALAGDSVREASLRILGFSEVMAGSSTRVASQNEITETGSIRFATHGEVTETASTMIAGQGEFTSEGSMNIGAFASSQVTESSSILVSGHSETLESGSTNIAGISEVLETASARVALHGETLEIGSTRIALHGYILETGSARIALTGEITESGSVRIVSSSYVTDPGSTRIAGHGESLEVGSTRIGIHGEVTEVASIRIALAGEILESGSIRIQGWGQGTELASVRISGNAEVTETGSVSMAQYGEVTENASIRLTLGGEVTEAGSVFIIAYGRRILDFTIPLTTKIESPIYVNNVIVGNVML